jgi:hypothetical protein
MRRGVKTRKSETEARGLELQVVTLRTELAGLKATVRTLIVWMVGARRVRCRCAKCRS